MMPGHAGGGEVPGLVPDVPVPCLTNHSAGALVVMV